MRHLRLESPGAVYHVTARGNDRAAIFHTEEDREHLLDVLSAMLHRHEAVLHAFVPMNAHFHLLGHLSMPGSRREDLERDR